MRRLLARAALALAALALLACDEEGGDGASTTATPVTPMASVTPIGVDPAVPATPIEAVTPAVEAVPTSEPAVAAVIEAIRVELATRVSAEDARAMPVISITRRDWPDACLGVTPPLDGVCAQVITPGYEILVGFPNGNTYVYHTDLRSNVQLATVYLEG